MSYTSAKITIHAEKFNTEKNPRYRIYLDDQIIIERMYWSDHKETEVVEKITLKNDDQDHTLEVCSVFDDLGTFSIKTVDFVDGDTDQIIKIPCTVNQNTITFSTDRR